MRLLLNIIWLVLSGFWLFCGYVLAGIIACIFIVTIPFGVASFRVAGYVLWPFGREVVDKGAPTGAGRAAAQANSRRCGGRPCWNQPATSLA